MPRVRKDQTTFTAGELDPLLAARIDVSRYYQGGERVRNMLIRATGGVTRRPGFRHAHTLPDGGEGVRLIDFAFSTEQTYLFALTPGTARIFRDLDLVATLTGCPWTAAMLPRLTWTQSADTLLLFHPAMPPQRVLRQGSHSAWTIGPIPLVNIPGFDYGAVTPSGTITPSATEGTVTLTASAPVFTAAMVGWHLRADEALARLTAVASATSATARVLRPFRNTAAIPASDWRLLEPVISPARGWPACGVFYQGRLYLGGLASRPATILGSKVGDYWNFDPGRGLDDEGIDVTIDTDQVNAVLALAATRNLHAFTTGGEHVLRGAGEGPITPATVRVEEQTRHGAEPGLPVLEADGALYFVERGGAALREHTYSDVDGAWGSAPASLLAEHLIRAPRDLAVSRNAVRSGLRPAGAGNYVFVVNDDGTVAVLTVLRSQEVVAWSLWETAGQVRAMAVLDGGIAWWAVARGGTVRLERWEDGLLLDAAVRTPLAAPTWTLGGLDHLNGMTVAVVGDGAARPPQTVTAGQVAVDPPATAELQVGLPFLPVLRTMPPEPRLPDGARFGRPTRLVQATIRLHDSGPIVVNGRSVDTRRFGLPPASPLDAPPPRITGTVRLGAFLGWQTAQVEITQPEPQPLTVLAVAVDLAV